MASRFCSQCGAEIPDGAQCTCSKCGTKLPASSAKNPGLAAILSLVVPGLGQSYNGNIIKGIGILFGIAVLTILMFLVSSFAIFLILLLWAVGVYDAYRDAALVNRGEMPERKQQVLLFCGVVGAVIVAGLVFAAILFFFMLSAIGSMFPDVRCANGECLTPLEGEAQCDTPYMCIHRAESRIRVHFYKDAMKFLDRALVLDPKSTDALALMGVARAESGDIAGAIAPLDRAVAISPNLSVVWENRGIVEAMSGNTTAAQAYLEKAAFLPGNSSLTWYNLGVARSLGGDASGAVTAFDYALTIDQNCTNCRYMEGRALIELGQYDDALVIFSNVTPKGQPGIESRQGKGEALAGLGRYSEACTAFDGAVDAYPFYITDIWSGVCNQTTRICQPMRTTAEPQTEADQEFNTLLLAEYDGDLKWRQDDPALWAKRGYALIQLMRYDEAVTSFDRSISLKPENAEAYNGKGVALFYKGIDTLSVRSFDIAADAAPLFINPRNNKAFVLARQGQYKEAAQAYQEAIYLDRLKEDPKGTGDFIFDIGY